MLREPCVGSATVRIGVIRAVTLAQQPMTDSTEPQTSKVAAATAGTARLNVGTSPPPVGGRLRWHGDRVLRKSTGHR